MHHRIQSIQELESLYKAPAEVSLGKEVNTINPYYQRLIEASPFFAIASTGPKGLDISPRGDPAGFVKVLDNQHIAIPDRRGNNRIDTLRNIVNQPSVALLFMIPGLELTLRYNGRAHLSVEPELLESLSMDGKTPVCAIVVTLETLFFQCARALKRANLWDPNMHADAAQLPSAGQLVRSAIEGFDGEDYDAKLEQRQNSSLY